MPKHYTTPPTWKQIISDFSMNERELRKTQVQTGDHKEIINRKAKEQMQKEKKK